MIVRKKKNYHEDLIESLKDPEEAIGYLRAALEENDMPDVFLLAIKNVAEAKGLGMSKISKETQLNREHLYKILSKNGNPQLSTLYEILDLLGLKLSIELKKAS